MTNSSASSALPVPTDVSVVLLPDVITRFMRRHPRLSLDIRVGNAPMDLVREGIDIAIRASRRRLADSSMTSRRIAFGPMHLYASPIYLARAGEPASFGDPAHDWITFGASPRGAVAPRVRADDFLLVRALLRTHLGVGVLPRFLAEPLVRSGELVQLLGKTSVPIKGGIFLVYPSRRITPKVAAFRDAVLEHARSDG